MIHIDIQEIDNGYIVTLFDSHGSSEEDETVHCKTFEASIKKVQKWQKGRSEK